jgi:hypothetical protein
MAMADPEVQRVVGPGTSADAAAPLTKDAIQAVWDGIAVGGGEMLANDDLVDGDVLIAVIDHAAYDRGRGGVGDYLPVRQRECWCCCTSSGAKRRCRCRIGWVERDGRITTMSWLEAPATAVMIGAAFVSEHEGEWQTRTGKDVPREQHGVRLVSARSWGDGSRRRVSYTGLQDLERYDNCL